MTTNFMNLSSEVLFRINESLHNAVDQQLDIYSLAAHIKKVYADLQQSRDFRELIEAARRFTPDKQNSVFSETLLEDHQCRLSLIGINRFAPIPVHDHPHITGVSLIIHGRVQVRNYRIQEIVREPSLVKLECLADEILGAGSTIAIENGANNLHGLQSMNLNAVCLALQTPPLAADRQAWYFPTHPLASHHQHSTWNRIIKSPRKTNPLPEPLTTLEPGGALSC
ncbi:MAG: hypothetical protein AB8G77_05255 [Rhodothermales bacterium]